MPLSSCSNAIVCLLMKPTHHGIVVHTTDGRPAAALRALDVMAGVTVIWTHNQNR